MLIILLNLEYVDVPAETLISILKKTGSTEQTDFDSKKYISCIKALQEKRPTIKCRLIVRVNRDISKGTAQTLKWLEEIEENNECCKEYRETCNDSLFSAEL